MRPRRLFVLLSVVALGLLGAAPVSANLIAPGGSGAPDVFTTSTAGPFLADTGVVGYTATDAQSNTRFTGFYREVVIADSTSSVCTNCLTFLLQVSDTSGSLDAISRITTAIFTGFSTDVGYTTSADLMSHGATDINPNTVDRSASGAVVGFNFTSGIPAGDQSAVLEIQTDATQFTGGTISVINGATVNLAGYAPTTVPEPATLFLLGSGLVALGGFAHRRIGLGG